MKCPLEPRSGSAFHLPWKGAPPSLAPRLSCPSKHAHRPTPFLNLSLSFNQRDRNVFVSRQKTLHSKDFPSKALRFPSSPCSSTSAPHSQPANIHTASEFRADQSLEPGTAIGRNVTSEPQATATPLLSALSQCAEADTVPLHFPGHKKGAGAPEALVSTLGQRVLSHDLPELPELDNLFSPSGCILEAQRRAAHAFGAAETAFLVNGSTVGVQASVMALCSPRDILLLPRNAHQSAFSAMIMSGAEPLYLMPEYDSFLKQPLGITPEEVERGILFARTALSEQKAEGGHPDAQGSNNSSTSRIQGIEDSNKASSPLDDGSRGVRRSSGSRKIGAVLVVSPTYIGVSSDLEAIARMCHRHGVPLIVDEAHGGHFRFHPGFPISALQAGADVVVQSTHKVLGSLTQSAMLHVSREGQAHFGRIRQTLRLLQSSSPSYLLLASLDAATAQVAAPDWSGRLEKAMLLARAARERLRGIPGLRVFPPEETVETLSVDPLRLTVQVQGLGLTGFEVDDLLRESHGVVAELPALDCITFAFSCGNSRENVDRLVRALEDISARSEKQAQSTTFPHDGLESEGLLNLLHGEDAAVEENSRRLTSSLEAYPLRLSKAPMTLREAFFAEFEVVGAAEAVGRLSSSLLCPYPPGIPILVPGEEITREAVEFLQGVVAAGGEVNGAEDEGIQSFLVVRRGDLHTHAEQEMMS